MSEDVALNDNLNDNMEEAILYAKKYLEDILSFFGLNTDVYATTEDSEVIELSVPSTQLNAFLIGQHGDTMRSLQFLTSNALRNNGFAHNRVNVDIADYKKARAGRLEQVAAGWIAKVKETGEPMDLEPMNPADRRTVHRLAGEEGVITESVGEGRDRHIVIKPGEEAKATKPKAKTKAEPAAKTETEPEATSE